MKKVLIGAGILLAVSAIGYGGYKGVMYIKHQTGRLLDYCMKFAGARIRAMRQDRVAIEVDLGIRNNSDISIELTSYDIDVSINGKHVSKIKSRVSQQLLADSWGKVTFLVDFDPRKTGSAIFNRDLLSLVLSDRSKINMTFKGRVAAVAAGIRVRSFPIDVSLKLSDLTSGSEKPADSSKKC